VVIWINDHPHAEFIGADDFDVSGELLSEIKVPGERGSEFVDTLMNQFQHVMLCLKLKGCLIEFRALEFVAPGL
jgi:hypothetical protein